MPNLQDLLDEGWIKVDHEFVPRFVSDGVEYTHLRHRNQDHIMHRRIIKEVHDLRVHLKRGTQELQVVVQDGKIIGEFSDLVLV